jgi:flagellar basal-body rod protein FlgB
VQKEVPVGNTISDAAIMAALGRQMTRAVARESAAAGNLANLDTPGYRTREVSFDQTLQNQLSASAVKTTNDRHFSTARPGSESAPVKETEGLAERLDGNNVQLDHELLKMTQAASDFAAAQTVLSNKFRQIRYAINEK